MLLAYNVLFPDVMWRALLMLTAVMSVSPTTGHIKPAPVVGSDVSSPTTIKLEETEIEIKNMSII